MDSTKKESYGANPFLALFNKFESGSYDSLQLNQELSSKQTPCQLVNVKEQQNEKNESVDSTKTLQERQSTVEYEEEIINNILQRVFLITFKTDDNQAGCQQLGPQPKRCVYLKDAASDSDGRLMLSWENIDQALMERLTMNHPRSNVIKTAGSNTASLTAELEAGELSNIKYLIQSYQRCYAHSTRFKDKKPELHSLFEKAKSLAVLYTGTCLLSPEMFLNQEIHKQFFNLLVSSQNDHEMSSFLWDLLASHQNKDDLESMFSPVLFLLNESKTETALFGTQAFQHLELLLLFAKSKELAELLVSSKSWLPPSPPSFMGHVVGVSGRSFQNQTLIGPYLALSSISTDPNKPSEYFLQPSDQSQVEMQATMTGLRTQIDSLSNKLHRFVFELVRASPSCKHEMLRWIGACLYSNYGRQKMMSEYLSTTLADDGFFLNLGTLLLKLCQPFLDPNSPKLLKIKPEYGATASSLKSTGIHCVGLEEETRLVTNEEDQVKLQEEEPFGFVTELFFITHRSLQLGLWKISEKYKKLMSELVQLQRVYQDASSQGADNEMIGRLKTKFEFKIMQQLSLKTHLLNPSMSELAMRFYVATASWLNQMALAGDDFKDMTAFRPVKLPLPVQTPSSLIFIPEFIVENMADFIIFTRHFSEETLESAGASLSHIVTFFVIYMGSSERIKNPHLRAKLAEALEALVPVRKGQELEMEKSPIAMFHREQAFVNHEEACEHLPTALLNLFIDIEFTGHSMEFEQKFGYRHHMYTVLEYIWNQPKYKETLVKLCNQFKTSMCENESEMKKIAKKPPLALKFFNLLINDAVFLLDESLEFMTQIKKLQVKQESGEIDSLPESQREAFLRDLRHTGQMAKSHNILAGETVHTLSYLTAEIQSPVCIPCMSERMAAMLNYFLLHLVGPKMGTLKVKDFSEFSFNPQKLVSDIVDIYINLADEEVFLKSVGGDQRSYSPDLFVHAERVLRLIGRPPEVIFKLNSLGRRIEEHGPLDDSDLPEIPDEFKDPIMDTLMRKPVILPTSGKIVDKEVICRHLLSDEKDPFNRKPLSIADLVPATELREKIEKWIRENSNRKDSSK